MTILGLAESLKTMNRSGLIWLTWPGPTVTLFDGSILGKYKRLRREIFTQPSFKSAIYAIKILLWYLSLFWNYMHFSTS